MSNTQNWRQETDADVYFQHQKKQGALADRRPVIRRASDLVGPGINTYAIRIDDFNNLLATFNGFYSALLGALNAPNSTENFVGYVASDAELGGVQVFTGVTSGSTYTRIFNRSPADPELIGWTAWTI